MTSAFASLQDDPNAPKKPGPLDDLAALGTPQQPVGTAAPAKPAPAPAPATPTTPAPATAPAAAPATPAFPAAPAAGMDPNAALGQVNQAYGAKFGGKQMTPQEQQALIKHIGYTGGAVSPEMLQKALGAVGQYSGDIANPFGPATPGTGTTTPTPVDPAAKTGGLAQEELQKLLLTGGTDGMQLDMDNPAIQAQRSNFDRMNSRETTKQRLAGAERAAARGTLGSGGFDADMSAAEQAQGDRASGFESQLMTQELQGQRERVMQGLQMALQSGDAAQARQLQERLGTLDATIRREGLGVQEKLGKGQLGLGLLGQLLGDKQAGNALGLGYFNAQNGANQNLLNSLLGAF